MSSLKRFVPGLRRLWLALGVMTSSKKEQDTATEDKGNGDFKMAIILSFIKKNKSVFIIFTGTTGDGGGYGINLFFKKFTISTTTRGGVCAKADIIYLSNFFLLKF